MDEIDVALRDYVATVNSGKYGDDSETLRSKFPELKDYEDSVLADYVATSNSNKYDDETLKTKFPEFYSSKEPEAEAAKIVEPKKEKAEAMENGELDSVSVEKDSLSGSKANNVETLFDVTNPELASEREELQNIIKNRSVMANNSKELDRLDEINKINEDFLKPKKSIRSGYTDQISELEAQMFEKEKKADRLSKSVESPFEKILEEDGSYQYLKEEKSKLINAKAPYDQLLKEIKKDTNSDKGGFLGKAGRIFGIDAGTNREADETIDLNNEVEEQILLNLEGDNRLQGKIANGFATLAEKESFISAAKLQVIKRENKKISDEAQVVRETVLDKNLRREKFEELNDRFETLLGAVGYDQANNILKNNFKKTKEGEDFDELLSGDGFFHSTSDAVSSFLEGTLEVVVKGTVGFATDVLSGIGDMTTNQKDYSVFDAFSDTVGQFTNFNYLPSSTSEDTRLVGEDGDFNLNYKTISKSLAETLPFTLAIINDVKKGKMTNAELALGKLLNPMKSGKVTNSLLLIDSAYRHSLSDNIEMAEGLGLDDNKGRVFAHTLAMSEGMAQLIMPDTKFFKTTAGNALLSNFKNDLKSAATKKAVSKAVKTFVGNIALELGEEEVVLATEDLLKFSMVVGHKNSEFFNVKRQKELAAATVIMSGTLGTPKLVKDFKANKLETYKKVSEDINGVSETLQRELDSGLHTEEVNSEIKSAMEWANEMNLAIKNSPSKVTGEQIDLLMEKQSLITEMKSVDDAFHPQYKDKIDKINAKINPINEKSESVEENKPEAKEKGNDKEVKVKSGKEGVLADKAVVTPEILKAKVAEIKKRTSISYPEAYKQATTELSKEVGGVLTAPQIKERAEKIQSANQGGVNESAIYQQAIKEIEEADATSKLKQDATAKPSEENAAPSTNKNLITSERINKKVKEIKDGLNVNDSDAYKQAVEILSKDNSKVLTPEVIKKKAKEIQMASKGKGESAIYQQAIKEIEAENNENNDSDAVVVVEDKAVSQPEVKKSGNKLFSEPNPETAGIVKKYKESKGIKTDSGENITELDIEQSKEIADAYDAMEDNPNDPEVKAAYTALAEETLSQYEFMKDAGYEVEMYEGEGEPYSSSAEMIADLRDNKHIYIFSTESGYGKEGISDQQRDENPMLASTEYTDKTGKPLLVNDVFRAVHDFFGHSERGNSFGAKGEENAWDVHARMYGDKARRAMTTETRGQNSWVNFNKNVRNEDGSIKKKGDEGYLSAREKPFADQKAGLLDEKYSQVSKPVSKFKTLADAIRSLKITKNMADASSKLQSNPLAIPAAVWDAAVETVASAVELTGSINEAINLGIENIKKSDWYKSLSKEERREALAKFKKQTLDVYNSDTITPSEAHKRSKQAAERSRQESSVSSKPFVERFKTRLAGLVDKYIDRQGSLKKALKNIGLKDVVTYLVNKGGYSAAAKNRAESVYKKTFKGLGTENIKDLEEIIQHLRTISISENRESRGLEQLDRQEGVTREVAKKALEGYKEVLGDKLYEDLNDRAEEYFKAYKEVLGEMKDAGLISQEFYDDFAEVDYKPTQYLEFLKDKDEEFEDTKADKGNDSPLGKGQIKTSTKGFTGSELMDAWGILERSILTRTRALFENKLNTTFVEEFTKQKKEVEALIKRGDLSKAELKRVKDFSVVDNLTILDEVTSFTEGGNPRYARDGKDNKGYKSLYYYTDGVKNRILLDENFYNKFTDTNNKLISGEVRENIAVFTGVAAVKSFATGNNPLFFATNLPRDFAFTVTFSKEYGNEVISNSVKLAIGMAKGIKSVFKNGKDYKLYLEHGGGMDYLALQGKYRSKGWSKTIVDKVLSNRNQDLLFRGKILRGINKFNLASEVGIRLAVFNKSLKNSLEGRDISKLDKKEQDLIYGRAVESARLLTDFSQGGTVTKALDAGIPYLNAATQGTRAAVNNFYERPLETSARIAQVAGYTVSATIAATLGMISQFRDDEDEEIKGMNNAQIYFETIETVSEYDLQNYYIMPLGTKDVDGNWKYSRVAKAQALSPFLNTAEHFTRLKLAEATGNKYEADLGKIIVNTTMENLLPISPTLKGTVGRNPIVNAFLATLGIDAYTGNPLSFDNARPDVLEGIDDDRVQPMFKKIGEEFNMSPVRLQKAIESIITSPSTNLYVGLSYAVGNATTSLLSDDDAKELGVDNLSPAFNRFVKSGSEYNRTSKLLNKVSPDALKAYRKHIMLKKDIKTSVANIKSGKKDLGDEVKRFLSDNSPEDATRIESWLRSEYKREDKTNLTYTLRRINNPEVKAIILSEKFGDGLFKVRGMNDSDMRLVKELRDTGILNGETLKYYKNLNDLD
jgi:hypothetical protein